MFPSGFGDGHLTFAGKSRFHIAPFYFFDQ